MKIIGLGTLHAYGNSHPDCRTWVANWIADAKNATWRTTHDIRQRYATASFLRNNVVVFNVRGNNHRLVTQVALQTGVISIKWIGSHADYDRQTF